MLFSNYLDLLTSHLYDYLRPRIIHENDITILSELCNVFLMYVMQDESNFGSYWWFKDEEKERVDCYIKTNVTNIGNGEKREVRFGHLIQNIMEDTQGRLVFRAQMFIQNDIQNYQSKPEDFEIHRNTG
jgi:hypothetical protein